MKIKEIKTRKSVRDFSKELLNQEQIDNIISAGLHTPTSMNTQAYKMVVVERADMSMELHAASFSQPHVKDASHCIYIFAMKNSSITEKYVSEIISSFTPEKEVVEKTKMITAGYKTGAYKTDLSGAAYALVNTMALEAKANGVGSTIFSGFDKAGVSMIMKNIIDINIFQPIVAISLGIPKDNSNEDRKVVEPKDKVLKYKYKNISQVA